MIVTISIAVLTLALIVFTNVAAIKAASDRDRREENGRK